jgi:uncharacterized protein (DUF1330 family)
MTAYAIAIITDTRMNDEVRQYLERIDATLAPYGGEYAIHGGPYTVLEGAIRGDIVAIRFPDHERALAWYESPAYQDIKALRTANTTGAVFLVHGVPKGHRGIDILAA